VVCACICIDFFFSKHERYKAWAVDIANVLSQCGFKVWISQFQQKKGNDIDSEGMQQGVRVSECVLLLLTKGIFDRDRHWVTKTEVSFGVLDCGKPLLGVLPPKARSQRKRKDSNEEIETSALLSKESLRGKASDYLSDMFDLDTKCHKLPGCVHPVACCCRVDPDFQPLARSIPVALNIARWQGKMGKNTTEYLRVRESVREIIQRYLNAQAGQEKLMREYEQQVEFGICPDSFSSGHFRSPSPTAVAMGISGAGVGGGVGAGGVGGGVGAGGVGGGGVEVNAESEEEVDTRTFMGEIKGERKNDDMHTTYINSIELVEKTK